MRRRLRSTALCTLLLAAAGLALAAPAGAAVLAVTKTADTLDGRCDSDCSLREAVVAANQGGAARDAIVLAPGVYRLTRAGAGEDQAATGDLDVTAPLTVIGAGADKTFIDGGGLDRVFHAEDTSLELLALTVQGGRVVGQGGGVKCDGLLGVYRALIRGNTAAGKDGAAGGLYVDGSLVMHESTVAGNLAEGFWFGFGAGGGIFIFGPAVINNSTVSGNRAPAGAGGGIFTSAYGVDFIVSNSTVTQNSAQYGGGITNDLSGEFPSGFPTLPPGIGLRNSLIAGNTAAGSGPDCAGSFVSDGYNLIGDGTDCELRDVKTGNLIGTHAQPIDPRLAPLGFYGGPTPTHALLPGSPALDTGSPKPFAVGTAYCQAIDQRGQHRSVDGNGDGTALCDIGAVEQSAACLSGGGTLCLQDGRFRLTTQWETGGGAAGPGQALGLSPDSGAFWFFDPGNLELTLKVLDGCALNGRYWVFASGLTNLEVRLTIEDTQTGVQRAYESPQGTVFAPILDTDAFGCE
jgi:CSLREA domain-containing protein